MLIRRAEVAGQALDLRIDEGRISALADSLTRRRGEPDLDAAGGALLPGLHDHHIHLFALAADAQSVSCGPPQVRNRHELRRALHEAAKAKKAGAWIRGSHYFESVAGELDRHTLDALLPTVSGRPEHPLRIQHRSGALWILNSAACRRLGLAESATGRLFGEDEWLRQHLAASPWPGLAQTSARLAAFGVTGLTDATPSTGAAEVAAFAAASERGELLQRTQLMGTPGLSVPQPPGSRLFRGARKCMLREASLPELGELREEIRDAHREERAFAVHCVTRTELLFACAAFEDAGTQPGDRIEHASVCPPETLRTLARLGLCVVTQPHFLYERGDAYLADVDPRDQPFLYRGASFLDAGVPLGGGTDAPYGNPDPWAAMRAATQRQTETGRRMVAQDALSPERALALFTSPLEAPGSSPRELRVGAPADLVLLDRPWDAARLALSRDAVRATFANGKLIYRPDSP